MNAQELEAEIEALGRPGGSFAGGLRGLMQTRQAAHEWDALYPHQAARYRELCAALDALREEQRAKEESAHLTRAVLARFEADDAGRAGEALEHLRETEALKLVRAWWAAGAAWLLLTGKNGNGKTVAAVWAMREALRRGEGCTMRLASRLARMSGFDEGAAELERLKRVPLLVVDDLGAEHASAWGQGLLTELFDARHQRKVRTIVTSNLDLAAFKTRVGERINDRIREDGSVHVVLEASLRRKRVA